MESLLHWEVFHEHFWTRFSTGSTWRTRPLEHFNETSNEVDSTLDTWSFISSPFLRSFPQLTTLVKWTQAESNRKATSALLAVGDVLPLAMAWVASKYERTRRAKDKRGPAVPYAFVGTAKSEFYVKETDGRKLVPEKRDAGEALKIYFKDAGEKWMRKHDLNLEHSTPDSSSVSSPRKCPEAKLNERDRVRCAVLKSIAAQEMLDGEKAAIRPVLCAQSELATRIPQDQTLSGMSKPKVEDSLYSDFSVHYPLSSILVECLCRPALSRISSQHMIPVNQSHVVASRDHVTLSHEGCQILT